MTINPVVMDSVNAVKTKQEKGDDKKNNKINKLNKYGIYITLYTVMLKALYNTL